jgi:MFS family permease
MRKKWFFIVPAAIVGMVLFAFIGGELVMHLWNWLLPPLFGWRQLTFWQAFGILALCRILFGRVGGRGFHRSNFRRRMGERWQNMTPEEREKFRQGMHGRCGFGTPASDTKES